jgi:carbamate kinase
VVASPVPLRLLEAPAVALLLEAGYAVVTNGGGGVPVVERADGTFEAVDAVIDKDRSSALLAVALGADVLVLSTSVERVALDFGRPSERPVDLLTIDEATGYLAEGQFPPGSMGPKITAAIEFLAARGGEVIITSLERVHDALDGKTGTRIVRGVAAA